MFQQKTHFLQEVGNSFLSRITGDDFDCYKAGVRQLYGICLIMAPKNWVNGVVVIYIVHQITVNGHIKGVLVLHVFHQITVNGHIKGVLVLHIFHQITVNGHIKGVLVLHIFHHITVNGHIKGVLILHILRLQ